MFTVGELSKETQTTADAIRHYARIGLLSPSRNPGNNYKLFSHDDVKRLKFICRAKKLGFTLQDIKVIFEHCGHGDSPCPLVRDTIEQRIEQNRVVLAELIAMQQRMDDALKKWKSMPDGSPDGSAICHLIESID
jgi:DNA-binding transcriptional MerR regulator